MKVGHHFFDWCVFMAHYKCEFACFTGQHKPNAPLPIVTISPYHYLALNLIRRLHSFENIIVYRAMLNAKTIKQENFNAGNRNLHRKLSRNRVQSRIGSDFASVTQLITATLFGP